MTKTLLDLTAGVDYTTDLSVKPMNMGGRDPEDALVLEVRLRPGIAARGDLASWLFALKQRDAADRLRACVDAGKAFTAFELLTDVNGRTYVSATHAAFFHKQHLRTSLTKLGF